MSVPPASTNRSSCSWEPASSVSAPNVIVPRHSSETAQPLVPISRYRMSSTLVSSVRSMCGGCRRRPEHRGDEPMTYPDVVARRMFDLTEPISLVNFFSDEPNEAMAALGFTNYWDGYFAGRSAPLGRVPAEVVDAAFYNFGDGEVARHIPKVWATTTPEAAHAARQRGCVAALRRILGDLVETPGLARAAELLATASTSAPTEGRVMYAALRSLPMPEEPVARLWPAANMLR